MNTESNNKEIKEYFNDLFAYKSYKEYVEQEALMFHYRVMQLVEKAMIDNGWNKKDLAEKTGKSQSYITQLFMGNKMVNLPMLALFQDALEVNFKLETESRDEKCVTWKYKKQKPSTNEYTKLKQDKSYLRVAEHSVNYELVG